MNLPELKKATQATVELLPALGPDGAVLVTVVIKQRFTIDRRDRVARVSGAEVRRVDVPWDEDSPATSSVKFPADVALYKPSTDVVVVGSAVGTYRPKVRALDVMVRVGPVEKLLRVFGPRVWYRGAVAMVLTDPEPFDALALRWEHAYGGFDASDPARPVEEARNPVGRGAARDAASLQHASAPQIEDLRALIVDHTTRPAPAGVGALSPGWQPRRGFAGTMDAAWMRERMPLPPLDYDARHAMVATPALVTPEHLRGGERVEVVNMNEQGPLQFALPRLAFYVGSRTDDASREHRALLDTVLLEPTDRAMELTWRATVPVPRPARRLRFIQVHEKELV